MTMVGHRLHQTSGRSPPLRFDLSEEELGPQEILSPRVSRSDGGTGGGGIKGALLSVLSPPPNIVPSGSSDAYPGASPEKEVLGSVTLNSNRSNE